MWALVAALGQQYDPKEWYLFIDFSKLSCILMEINTV
jgi:hypothetical protein